MFEMYSKYNPVLQEHLIRLKQSTWKLKASVTDFATKTQNALASVLTNHINELLVVDGNSAMYFGIKFGSRHDTDQMCELIRSVRNYNSIFEVREIVEIEKLCRPCFFKRKMSLTFDIIKNVQSGRFDVELSVTIILTISLESMLAYKPL